MKKIELIYKDNSELTNEFQNNFSNAMSEIISVEKITGKEISPDDLKSVSGHIGIYNQNKNKYWLLDEDFPIGDFPIYFLEENNLACVVFNDKMEINNWKKAKISRLYYSFNKKYLGMTTDVKKQFILPEANCIYLGDVEALLSQKIRFEFDLYPDSGQYKYRDSKMLETEDAAVNSYLNVLSISLSVKEGIYFPFIGYDSEDNVACLLFHFKSNSEVKEGKQ